MKSEKLENFWTKWTAQILHKDIYMLSWKHSDSPPEEQSENSLGNLRVRYLNHEKKCPWRKWPWRNFLKYHIGLKHPKMTILKSRGGVMLQVSLSSSNCALSLPQNALLFPKLSFHLPELSFYSPELPFCFPEMPFCFSERSFYISKMPYCFPQFPLSFPQVPSFYLLASFSNDFFSR